jgi:23S rRNA pseudouridine2605 synthase
MEERIQKIMARSGLGSRRDCEELIATGRVKVNGTRAILGTKADSSIMVDGRLLPKDEPERVYIALNKPRNVLSDSDPDDPRQNVRDLIPIPGHMFTVGRLDFESEGLILMTNDGDLANKLTHPRYGHEKEYRVLLAATPDEEQLETWRRGVVLEDGERTLPADVRIDSKLGKGAWVRVIMREGRKRQIREIGKRIGLPVVRILRVRIGTLRLGDLKPREWRNLTLEEVNTLRSLQEQATSRKNHLPGRTLDENSERNAARKRRPFSPHNPSASGARKPGAPTRRRVGPPSDKPYTGRTPSTGPDWKTNPSHSNTTGFEKRETGTTGEREPSGHTTGWKPGSALGRKPGSGFTRSPARPTTGHSASKPPARVHKKPKIKN